MFYVTYSPMLLLDYTTHEYMDIYKFTLSRKTDRFDECDLVTRMLYKHWLYLVWHIDSDTVSHSSFHR